MNTLVIRGARQNNLCDVDLDIPRNKLVVITGLSGSGKSSLAFDTIYAEGQRRYVESLSVYARQFLQQQGKPEVDTIEGLSPAISIEQRPLSKNPRSTVGTVTEVHDYLRLLFARVGRPQCPTCAKPITSQSSQQIVDQVLGLPQGCRLAVLAPVVRGLKGDFTRELHDLRREGFVRVNIDGEVLDLADDHRLDPQAAHNIEVYVDRLVLRDGIRARLSDSLELALKLAHGVVKVAPLEQEEMLFSENLVCMDCGTSLPEMAPRTFSFNNPQGACPLCSGLGQLMEFDEQRLVPDPRRSLREGAIEPWSSALHQKTLEALASKFGFDLYAPYEKLSAGVKQILMWGSGDVEVNFGAGKGGRGDKARPFEGVIPRLQQRMKDLQRRQRRAGGAQQEEDALGGVYEEFRNLMSRRTCPQCLGARLRREAQHVLVGGKSICEVSQLSIHKAVHFFAGLELSGREEEIGSRLLREINSRLTFLADVGLGYLTLDRTSATLSGGEGQRVRLATQIGSALMGVIYILDEPSIGLHKKDQARLLSTLVRLRDMGNTVLVVEHDEDTIRLADHVVDMGPGAGVLGGNVVAQGTVKEVMACGDSLTGQYLCGALRIAVPRRRRQSKHRLVIRGARHNNLQDIDIRLPLGVLTCVTGVSGSGKSTLIIDTLLPALRQRLHHAHDEPGAHRSLEGVHLVDKVIAIDQSPIGRTPRSNPATYTGMFTKIRELFAGLPRSKVRGYKAGRYSFNVKGGRCEACQGDGILRIAMHFLPDIFVQCEVCGGRRYNRETLAVKYKGRSIADILDLTIRQAGELLANIPAIRRPLQTLQDVGLGYLTLGQPATTLSGGEAQRLKLSKELSRRSTGNTLYILDEPTTGLHLADIHLLLEVLNLLVDAGNTVVIIEHHLDVLKCADQIIDLGPAGGEGGGQLVAAGTPEEVARAQGSHTGEYLRQVL